MVQVAPVFGAIWGLTGMFLSVPLTIILMIILGHFILISSHILLELADLCNVVGIIEQGQMQFHGTIQEIMQRASVGMVLHIGVTNRHMDAVNLLKAANGVTEAELVDGHIRVAIDSNATSAAEVAHHLFTGGFGLTRLEEEKVNLETAFMRLTKGLVQ